MRSPKSEFFAPIMSINFGMTYRDGSDPNFPKGYYWLAEIDRDENGPIYGSLHGPHATDKQAEDDARAFLTAEIKRLSGGASLVHVKQ